MRPPDNPPGNEKDREELGFLSGLDLTGTVDTALVEIRDSFKARFESSTFCVYQHHHEESPFYVGMAQEKRDRRPLRVTSMRNHNRQWREVVRRKGIPKVSILKGELTLEEAKAEEARLIDEYRREGVPLVNIRGGGEIVNYLSAWKISQSLKLHFACQRIRRHTEATARRFAGIQQEFAL
jgi:hypothetical protein